MSAARSSGAALDWSPTASLAHLRRRAEVLAHIRAFFAARLVLEVETPLLGHATVTDPHLASLSCSYTGPLAPQGERLYLQTSPEFAMKRLLAAGSGPIYQLCKAFRDHEAGRHHNPEFTLLEWYRPGFDHHRLMDEMDELLAEVLGSAPAERLTYGELFLRHLGIDPHCSSLEELASQAAGLGADTAGLDRDGLLALLLTHLIEPRLEPGRSLFVYDYPRSQAALARLRRESRDDGSVLEVAERFEVYVGPVELANGFHELLDAAEQRRRFEADLDARRRQGQPTPPLDERLLAALEHGLPACAGVALGVDRLVMLTLGASSLEQVVAFPISRA